MSSQSIAARILASLCANGVSDFLLSPGSRSQALAVSASQLERANLARLTVRLDERSMSFTALGIAQAKKEPVALIVTSGSAVANLMPAVLEAYHSGVPLILLTADRPARLRGRGANQTTNQVNIFGFAATCFDLSIEATDSDAEAVALSALQHAIQNSKPVQINVQFDTPLSSPTPDASELVVNSRKIQLPDLVEKTLTVPVDNHTVVIAGAGGSRAREFAESANLPLLAEPNSGARSGANAISNYLPAISALRTQIRKVVVFGKPTLSRIVQKLISESSVYVENSRSHGPFDPFENVIASGDRLIPDGIADDGWLSSWTAEGIKDVRSEFVNFVWSNSSRLVLGASDLIRVLDSTAEPKEIEVYSNRGLSGIDGTVSTAIGVCLAQGETTALLGDLTLLHDAGGLNLSDLGELDLRIVVGNDQGGHIFSRLEIAKEVDSEDFQRLFTTPQRVDLEKLAAAYGWRYRRCASVSELESAWQLKGPVIIDYQLGD